MEGFKIDQVYSATLTQLRKEGGDNLKIIWEHESKRTCPNKRNINLSSNGTYSWCRVRKTRTYNTYYDESSQTTLKLGGLKNGTVQNVDGFEYNEFPFPLKIGEFTKHIVGYGAGGKKQHIGRSISVHPNMKQRIITLNENATRHIAAELASRGEGVDDVDRWYMAQRIIAGI